MSSRARTPERSARKEKGTDAAARTAPRARPVGNSYMYGNIRWPAPKGSIDALGAGVGDPPRAVRAVRVRELAALISDVSGAEMQAQGLRGTRRDMKAHAAVVNRIAAAMTVLPVRFGVVLPDERSLIAQLLEPQYKRLLSYLDHLEGTVEVKLRAMSLEEPTLREVVAERDRKSVV